MKHTFLIVAILMANFPMAQEFQSDIFSHKNGQLPFRILLPENFDAKRSYPLVLVLHGAGERGDDNVSQLIHGSYLFQSKKFRAEYPSIVVFPQCPKDSYWANVLRDYEKPLDQKYRYSKVLPENPQLEIVEAFLEHIGQQYNIDPSRRYVGGLSMGGMGTFELVSRNPDYFAAAFPICGGGHTNWAPLLQKTPLWIFHGEKDNVVPVKFSVAMFDALKAVGAPVKLTLYPEVLHDSWHNAFADPALMEWLFSNQKK
ncbi:MAG: alpha/beta hydrolase-fold protein [Bacteroidetes bacterium]|nr:alpha/beta hydrolase-fold protein [Bacteroidota bacterium]